MENKKLVVRSLNRNNNYLFLILTLVFFIGVLLINSFLYLLFGFNIFNLLFFDLIILFFYLLYLSLALRDKLLSVSKNSITIERQAIDDIKNDNYSYNSKSEDNKPKKIKLVKTAYVGSLDTKVYHRENCRFVNSIEDHYKDFNNKPSYFKRKGYKPCLLCINT